MADLGLAVVPVLGRLAADPARRHRPGQPPRPGLLRPAHRRADRQGHRPGGHALPLGPAADAGGPGRLDRPGDRRGLRRVRPDRARPPRRPGHAPGPRSTSRGARPTSATPAACTRPASPTRPSAFEAVHHLLLGHGLAARALRAAGAQSVSITLNPASVLPARPGQPGRRRRRPDRRRPAQPDLPRPAAARALPGRHARAHGPVHRPVLHPRRRRGDHQRRRSTCSASTSTSPRTCRRSPAQPGRAGQPRAPRASRSARRSARSPTWAGRSSRPALTRLLERICTATTPACRC